MKRHGLGNIDRVLFHQKCVKKNASIDEMRLASAEIPAISCADTICDFNSPIWGSELNQVMRIYFMKIRPIA